MELLHNAGEQLPVLTRKPGSSTHFCVSVPSPFRPTIRRFACKADLTNLSALTRIYSCMNSQFSDERLPPGELCSPLAVH